MPNDERKTITISVTGKDKKKIEKVQNYIKEKRGNFSGIVVNEVLDWYKRSIELDALA